MSSSSFIKGLLKPSAVGIVLYIVFGFILMLSTGVNNILDRFISQNNNEQMTSLIHNYTKLVMNIFSQSTIISKITIFLLWASVGAIAYILIWFLVNTFIDVGNDIIIGTHYVGGPKHVKAKYWSIFFVRSLLRGGGLLLLLVLTILVQVWHPISAVLLLKLLNHLTTPINWLLVVLSFIIWVLILHIYVVLIRLTLLRTRIIETS